jgi:hypothetical protein
LSRKVHLLFIALLACGLIAAGCGGNDNKDKNSGGSGASPSGTQALGGAATSNPNAKQAVENCKRAVEQSPQISASAKNDLKDICDKAASGDAEAVRKASRDVCVKVAKDTVPAGPSQDQAVSACKQVAPGQ